MSGHPICDFYGCTKPICNEDLDLAPPSMRFCQEHHDELVGYVRAENTKAIMRFWVQSHGGAKRMAGEVAKDVADTVAEIALLGKGRR